MGDVAYALRLAPCSHEAARLLAERLERLTVEAKPRHRQPSTRLRSRLMASGATWSRRKMWIYASCWPRELHGRGT
jgi:hypothetical protein